MARRGGLTVKTNLHLRVGIQNTSAQRGFEGGSGPEAHGWKKRRIQSEQVARKMVVLGRRGGKRVTKKKGRLYGM